MIDSQPCISKNGQPANRKAGCLWAAAALLSLVLFPGCQPPGPRALLQGERLIREEKFAQAVEKLEAATWLLPQNAQAWNYLGLAYHGAGKVDDAIRAYQKSVSLDRNLAAARFNLGMLFLEQNRNPEAASELTTFTALQPNSMDGWLNLGTAQLRARRLDDAERAFVRAQKLDPNNPEMLDDLGVIQLQRKKPREALSYFTAAVKQDPKFAPAILNQAIVLHYYLNNRPAALQKYEEYLGLKPSSRNIEAVQETARRLADELRPKPMVLNTNMVATARTNAQPIAGSNTVGALRGATNTEILTVRTNVALKTDPATNQVPTNTLASLPANNGIKSESSLATARKDTPALVVIAEPEREVKTEVVQIQEEPPPAPAREIVQPQVTPITVPATQAANAQSHVSATNNSSGPLVRPVARDTKPGLTEKLNPMKWFRKESRVKESSTAGTPPVAPSSTLAPAPEVVVTNSIQGTIVVANKVEPVPEPAPIPPRRYVFDKFEIPPGGNRAEAQAAVTKGVTAFNDNRLGAALEAYHDAVRADPGYFDAYYNLALAAYQMHNLPLSLSSGERALRIRPDSAEARYNFALALEESQYPFDAQDQLREVLARHPQDARAHFALATLEAETLRNPTLARQHFRRVLELEPNHPNATQIRYWLAAHP